MKLDLTQEEFGQKLGVKQKQIAMIELGRYSTLERPFTYWAFSQLLGSSLMFVMFGTNPERYPAESIRAAYWTKRNKRPTKAAQNVTKD